MAVPPAIEAPGGASLTGAVVSALTVNSHSNQVAGDPPPAAASKAIGRVETVTGPAEVVRNGQTVTLHAGDLVYKDDAVHTGDHAALAITFLDGTAFNLSANARMVLNSMVYEPGGSSNSSLLSLVQGSISFVAGDVAHSGDMKVDTPVATMGIGGTAVHVEIGAKNGETHFSVMREPSGRVGRYVLYDRAHPDKILATVADAGMIVTLEMVNGQIIIETVPKTETELAEERAFAKYIFEVFQAGQANSLLHQLGLGEHGRLHPPGQDQSHHSHGSSGTPETPNNIPSNHDDLPSPHSFAPEVAPPTFTPVVIIIPDVPAPSSEPSIFVQAPSATDTIHTAAPVSGGTVTAASPVQTIDLLSGATNSNPANQITVATGTSGTPEVTVHVLSGSYDPASIVYSVDAADNLHIDPAQFGKLTPGTSLTLDFTYTLVDASGGVTVQSAILTIDGGSAAVYAPVITEAGASVTSTPVMTSPEGGDTFALTGASGGIAHGLYGSATIDASGAVTYTAVNGPAAGTVGTDSFTVSDTDSLGVTTTSQVSFTVDGGTAVSYAAATVTGTSPVTDTPTLVSPEGGDHFAFVGASGALVSSVTGAFGTAMINSATGVITYTATAGAGGTDTFTVSDTDGHGVTTTATASFSVDGGPSLSYTAVDATGTGAVSDTPVLSSSGGDSFSFAGASGSLGSSVTGAFGTATIDPATGVITYTPSAIAGTAGTDTFTVSDTDGHGVTTTATAVFNVDGGTAATYADVNVTGTSPVTDTPTLVSPKGGDSFAFVGASGALVSSVTGSFGTATIDAATGEITYTATPARAGPIRSRSLTPICRVLLRRLPLLST